MPLEWMIVDSLQRGVCTEDVKAPYVNILSSFRDHLFEQLHSVLPEDCQTRFKNLHLQKLLLFENLAEHLEEQLEE